jgi:hypothetical protein
MSIFAIVDETGNVVWPSETSALVFKTQQGALNKRDGTPYKTAKNWRVVELMVKDDKKEVQG